MNHVYSMSAALIGAALALSATVADAKVYAFSARSSNFSAPGTPAVFVPIAASGATALSFNTAANNKKIIITFTAECANSAANNTTWVNVDILVDGAVVAPTNQSSDAFCTSNGTSGNDGWVTASTTVGVIVPTAGAHTVQVRAVSSDANSATSIWVSDASLVIQD